MTEETPSEEVSEKPEVTETTESLGDTAEIDSTQEHETEDDASESSPEYTPLRISREALPRWRGQIRRFLKLSEAQVALGWPEPNK